MSYDTDTLARQSRLRGQAWRRFDCFGAAGLTGTGLTAAFAVGLAFLGDARRRGAFFADFFLIVLVFLTVLDCLRVAALVTGVFLRFALPFFLVAITTSRTLTGMKLIARSLPNKKVSQRARPSPAMDISTGEHSGWLRQRAQSLRP